MSASSDSKVIAVTDTNFKGTVLESDQPFLLDLSAEWCGPCKAIAPTVAELATQYDGKVHVGALDIDDNPEVPSVYKVRSVPTLIMFSEGEVVGQLIGAHPRQRIVDLIEEALK